MAGLSLIDQLLSGTRFDNKDIIKRRMGTSGVDAYGRPLSAPSAPVQTAPRSNDPENMIRELRRQRQLQQEMEAAQALQRSGGQVFNPVTKFVQPKY